MISAFLKSLRERTDNLALKKSTVQSDEPKTKTTQFKVPQPVFNALDLLRQKALDLVGKFKVIFAKLTENLTKYTQLVTSRQIVQKKQATVVQQVVNTINNVLQQNLLPQLNPQQAQQQMQNALNIALQYGQPNNLNNNQPIQYLQALQQLNPNARYLIVERIRCEHEAYNVKTSDGSELSDSELVKALREMPRLQQGVMFVKQLLEMRPELKDSDENEQVIDTSFDLFKDNNLGDQYGNLQSEYNGYTEQMNDCEYEIRQQHRELSELNSEMNDLPPEFIQPHPDYQKAILEEEMRTGSMHPDYYKAMLELVEKDMRNLNINSEYRETPRPF